MMSVAAIKDEVRIRDNMRCTECGMPSWVHQEIFGRRLEVHRLSLGSEYTLEGCVTLCDACHILADRALLSKPGPKREKNVGTLITADDFARLKALADIRSVKPCSLLYVALMEYLANNSV